ncbi:PQQ-dependent sugar dehydrogenase [Lacisediminimonas sp.]|uniref:PQQ-dependent sugar dehydrogenase n=1 Tax=Lacisediminimonas sp. TaxID=3060582 RepID=UPI00351D70A9
MAGLLASAIFSSAPTSAQSAQSAQTTRVTPEILVRGLAHPWSLAFIGSGRMLVTEREGRLRLVQADGRIGPPIQGLPKIESGGQGGLLDVIADTGFANNRRLYFCFTEPGEGGNSTALAAARLSDDAARLEQVTVIFSQKPKVNSSAHFGCRIVEQRDTLFLTLGDRFSRMQDAQRLDKHLGKVVRINKNGSIPADNPFADRSRHANALPEIWSYGHRNVQGATLGPDGNLWTNEHGPRGGDEVNRTLAGRNYGWPLISYGVHYSGLKVGDGASAGPGMEQPVYYWTPSIAPSGMAFLRSDRYGPAWRGNLFVGALKFQYLSRLEMRGDQVVKEEKLLENLKQRIRDVRQGPDGLLYVLTDESDGQLIRLVPEN